MVELFRKATSPLMTAKTGFSVFRKSVALSILDDLDKSKHTVKNALGESYRIFHVIEECDIVS